MFSQRTLSIIIVNWNGKNVLPACLRSIAENPPGVDYRVVVVDNASTDETRGWLASGEAAKIFPEGCFEVILNDENVGFGRANNQAMRAFPAEYYFLLNSDAEVCDNAIDLLLQAAKEDTKIGAVGPKLLNTDGTLQTSVWHTLPSAWIYLADGLRIYKILPKKIRGELLLGSHWDHNRRRSVPVISGAAMFITSEAFRKTDGFDESFHMYGEDLDLCFRIGKAGFEIIFIPEARVIHHGGQSSFLRWKEKSKIKVQLNAFLRFQEKHLSRSSLILNCLAALSTFSLERIWRKIRGYPTYDIDVEIETYGKALKRYLFNGKN